MNKLTDIQFKKIQIDTLKNEYNNLVNVIRNINYTIDIMEDEHLTEKDKDFGILFSKIRSLKNDIKYLQHEMYKSNK